MTVINWLLEAIQWIGDNWQRFLLYGGILAVIILALLAKRIYGTLKAAIANLFTPSGFVFFIVGMIALIVFLKKYNLI
ncbi:MAG: hypothetical protein KKG64_03745 [Firmicutes bacterium]|nr:hypothetical protein [Bacillota bacterium]